MRTAATVITNDPIFGLVAYGGDLHQKNKLLEVVPKDGLRRKIYYRNGSQQLDVELLRDGFRSGAVVTIDPTGSSIRFTLENRTSNAHELPVFLKGLSGSYLIKAGQGITKKVTLNKAGTTVSVAVPAGNNTIISLTRTIS